jgi:hypothetical protein
MREVTDQDIANGRPLFFAIAMGTERQLWAVLTAFMEFVASQPTEQFSRDLSFVLIPRKRRNRLTRVL